MASDSVPFFQRRPGSGLEGRRCARTKVHLLCVDSARALWASFCFRVFEKTERLANGQEILHASRSPGRREDRQGEHQVDTDRQGDHQVNTKTDKVSNK